MCLRGFELQSGIEEGEAGEVRIVTWRIETRVEIFKGHMGAW
jgi:hypothetical protein